MSRTGKSSKARAKKGDVKVMLQLPEVLDLTAAAPLAQSLLTRRGADLTVDASQVSRIGAQCLQVLLSAEATWKADGMRLSLDNPTEAFLKGTALLGITFDQSIARSETAL